MYSLCAELKYMIWIDILCYDCDLIEKYLHSYKINRNGTNELIYDWNRAWRVFVYLKNLEWRE
jgi:predicted DsbA family dithiol-disulfide isomerase